MEKARYLKRVNGGAIQTATNHYAGDSKHQKTCSLETETAIAYATAELIPDGCTLFINALEQLEHFRANKAILSIDGVCVNSGITTYHVEEVPLCRTMMKHSSETIVIADSSKWGCESFSNISSLEYADCYVTDDKADAATTAFLKGLGKQVILTAMGV